MAEFMNIDAVMTAFDAGWNDMANAIVVVIPLCLLAAAELFRAR